jgi:hypothetical protein
MQRRGWMVAMPLAIGIGIATVVVVGILPLFLLCAFHSSPGRQSGCGRPQARAISAESVVLRSAADSVILRGVGEGVLCCFVRAGWTKTRVATDHAGVSLSAGNLVEVETTQTEVETTVYPCACGLVRTR